MTKLFEQTLLIHHVLQNNMYTCILKCLVNDDEFQQLLFLKYSFSDISFYFISPKVCEYFSIIRVPSVFCLYNFKVRRISPFCI